MQSQLTPEFIEAAVTRSDLRRLEASMEEMEGQIGPDDFVTHHFAPGMYARQIDLPEGSAVVGKIHKHAHLNFLLTGVVRVVSEFHTETFAAPRMWVSEPGIKRAVYTLEDAVWVTVHPNPTDEEDVFMLEDAIIAPHYEALDAFLTERLEEL